MQEVMAEEKNVVTDQYVEDGNLFSGLPSEYLHEITPAKRRMILLYLTGQYTIKTIASTIGVNPVTIRSWLNQPVVQEAIVELQSREFVIIDSSLKALRMEAIETMKELMASPMDNVRYQASKDILDRTGHKPVTEMRVDKTVTTIEKQLQDLADVTIAEAEVIDISDVVELVKNGS